MDITSNKVGINEQILFALMVNAIKYQVNIPIQLNYFNL